MERGACMARCARRALSRVVYVEKEEGRGGVHTRCIYMPYMPIMYDIYMYIY